MPPGIAIDPLHSPRYDPVWRACEERGVMTIRDPLRLKCKPSEYWQTKCWLGSSFMTRADAEDRAAIGVGKIMWGSDFPHEEGTYPPPAPGHDNNEWTPRASAPGPAVGDTNRRVSAASGSPVSRIVKQRMPFNRIASTLDSACAIRPAWIRARPMRDSARRAPAARATADAPGTRL